VSPGRRFPSPAARAEAGGGGPDLTPPATPSPQVLTSGTTSLGSTSIGSWSDTVTVAATVTASSGSPPTATVTGSGAGPYSVSIASGLADGRVYAVRLRGTGADGQVADVVLAVVVEAAAAADLTPPATPTPQVLASGTTSLGSTSIGSWSSSVTVTATVSASAGSPPTATVSGSGAGPYSVSIASGLASGRSYAVRLRGTAADGQVADVVLAIAVGANTGAVDWKVVADYDLTTVDTASATTGTTGSIALTVGGAAFLTLTGIDGIGTGSITPTNGSGLVFAVTTTGQRSILLDPDWTALGVSNHFRRIYAVEAQGTIGGLATNAACHFMMTSTASGSTTNSNVGSRLTYNGTVYSINARTYHSASTNHTSDTTTGTLPTAWSASVLRCPEGVEVCHGLTALPGNPDLHSYVGRRRSQDLAFVNNLGLRLGTDPKLAIELFGSTGANSTLTVSRLRISVLEVV
jgi:hypothetical protein